MSPFNPQLEAPFVTAFSAAMSTCCPTFSFLIVLVLRASLLGGNGWLAGHLTEARLSWRTLQFMTRAYRRLQSTLLTNNSFFCPAVSTQAAAAASVDVGLKDAPLPSLYPQVPTYPAVRAAALTAFCCALIRPPPFSSLIAWKHWLKW